MKGKKLIALTLSMLTSFGSFTIVNAQGNNNLLLEGGVQVTTSSAEMEAGANSADNGTKDPTIKRSMDWYKADQSEIKYANTALDSLDLVKKDSSTKTIEINDEITYQSFLGMGSSVEESTVYNLTKMTNSKQKEVIKRLIDPVDGAGMTLFRLPIGASDYVHMGKDFYSYYDVKDTETFSDKIKEPDWYNETGNGFSIQVDKDLKIINTIHLIQEVAKECGVEDDIKFFASPWSLPGWMKNFDPNAGYMDISKWQGLPPGSVYMDVFGNHEQYKGRQDMLDTRCWGLVGGSFDDDCYNDAAMYFRRYLEEYANEGIDIYAITLQNEPGVDSSMPTCKLTANQAANLARAVKNTIKNSDVDSIKDVNIWGLDYNADAAPDAEVYPNAIDYLKTLLETDQTSIDGVGLHDYSNGQRTMEVAKEIQKLAPNLDVAVTERSLWGTYGMNRVVEFLRSNVVGYTSFVTMIDSNCNSHQMGTNPDPTLLIQNAEAPNEYRIMPEVNMMGQFSKYIRPGYQRVDSTDSVGSSDYGISNVVFKNPDTNELVMVVVNNSNEAQTFTASCDDYQFTSNIEPCNVVTYQWNPNAIDREVPIINGTDAKVELGTKESIEAILGLSINDNRDGIIDLKEATIETNYNKDKEGTYTVKVSVKDRAGNEAEETFTITVEKRGIIDTNNNHNATNQPDISKQPEKSDSVKTGDNVNMLLWSSILVVTAISAVIFKKKKNY